VTKEEVVQKLQSLADGLKMELKNVPTRDEMLAGIKWWLDMHQIESADIDDDELLDLWGELREVDDE
jgi:hypothetical protein